MANEKFTTSIDKFVVDTEKKMLIVARESIEKLVEEAQTPVLKGGKMRVDTGFLRSSGVAALNAVPRGPSKGDKKQRYTWTGDSVTVTLAKMKLGDSFFFGWTANYTKYREAYDGFLDSALQKWQSYVNMSVRRFKK
jgi:hypothetical protein